MSRHPAPGPLVPVDSPRSIVERLDARLAPFHAERLARLGEAESGLFAHYRRLLERDTVFGGAPVDRLAYLLRYLPPYDSYVVYRAGLGEFAFALALAGRRVIAWEPNAARRAAIKAGRTSLARSFRAVGKNLVVADEDPAAIPLEPRKTSLGIAFDLLLGGKDADEAGLLRRTVRTHALLYDPRLLVRVRDDASAAAEARAVLEAAGFDSFPAIPAPGLALATRGRVQPKAALPVEGATGRRADPKGRCKGLIALIGSSYSGSTLLNTMLGAHPQVAGGGELHWLTKDSPRGVCAVCGETCPVWTARARASVTPSNLYDATARAFDRPVVCDSSKMPAWFRAMLPAHAGIPQLKVLVVKHPVRHVASYRHRASYRPELAQWGDPAHVLDHLFQYYAAAFADPGVCQVVRYEDLVARPKATLGRLLDGLGLSWAPVMADWRAQPHHHIGGNPGPLRNFEGVETPSSDHHRRKYAGKDLFLDDSFREVLDERAFEAVVESPVTAGLSAMLGYAPLEWRPAA